MAELRSLHHRRRAPATLGDQGTDRGLSGGTGGVIALCCDLGNEAERQETEKRFSAMSECRWAERLQIR